MLVAYSAFVLLLVAMAWRAGWRSPATLLIAYFLAVMALDDALPIGLAPLTTETRLTVLLGLAGFALPAAVAARWPVRTRNDTGSWEDSSGAALELNRKPPARMLAWTIVLVALMLVGYSQSPHAGLGALSLTDIRGLTTRQALAQQDIGLGPLLLVLAPLVAGLGVLGGVKYGRRRWLFLVPLALAPTLTDAEKTLPLTVVFTTIALYLLWRRLYPRGTSSGRGRPLLMVGLAAAVSLGIFLTLDAALGKDVTLSQELPQSWVPAGLLGPAVYEFGGLSALSVAQSAHIDPRFDDYGRSIYAIPWALRFVDASFHKPQTITGSVSIPIGFNVYTGFGDMWFDFSWPGVFLLSALFGTALAIVQRRLRPDAYHWAVVLALLTVVMAQMTLVFALLWLDTLFQIVIAYVAFRHIAAAEAPSAAGVLRARPADGRRSETA